MLPAGLFDEELILYDEDITVVDTPMTFPTSNFKSSSTPTSIQIRNSGAAHTKTVTQVAYVLRFGRSTYAWKAKEISFPMDPATCLNLAGVNRNCQNYVMSRICQSAAPPSFWDVGPCTVSSQVTQVVDVSLATTSNPRTFLRV